MNRLVEEIVQENTHAYWDGVYANFKPQVMYWKGHEPEADWMEGKQ